MREFKFRGWDATGQKRWVYGNLVHNQKVTKTGLEPKVKGFNRTYRESMKKEGKYCGGCCWFCHEDTDGFGICYQDNNPIGETFGCSHVCHNDAFVSREQMRHYQAVLLAQKRWMNDDIFIHYAPDGDEVCKAIDFAVKYIEVFSNL